MKRYKLVNISAPAFVTIASQKYLLPGWIPVEADTSFDDIDYVNPYRNLKTKEFKVSGSRGGEYTVTAREGTDGSYKLNCTCPGNKFRGKCKHVDAIKNQEGY